MKEFEILSFDPMLSDLHCGIQISLLCSNNDEESLSDTADTVCDSDVVHRAVWLPNASETFLQNLNADNISQFIQSIDAISNHEISKEKIEVLTSQCSSLLFTAADKAGMIKQSIIKDAVEPNWRKHKKVKRPWFNVDCRNAQMQFRRFKCQNRRIRSAENLQACKIAGKSYKKCLNKHFSDYKKEFIKKIRGLKNSDPKSYWKLLNKSDSCKPVVQKISLDVFTEHFKKLNQGNNTTDGLEIDPNLISENNLELNSEITEPEVLKCLNSLKLNKACASDLILNEFLKYSRSNMLTAFTKLFNVIFNTGFIPEAWSQGIISPIYKNKGDRSSPDNYRGITILSCFGKLFTAVLNNRLNKYLENMNILCEEQAGFRKDYSTIDHIFNLKCLIDLYLFRGRKLYCAFIDYKKAFDSVNRAYLWQKLLSNNIDGKMFKIIHGLYANAKSCVKINHMKSTPFLSNVGVRQGENLSPVLFSLFLNDLSDFISHAYNGLNDITAQARELLSDDDIEIYLKLYILLYADDTVIFAEDEYELQAALNAMFLYCKSWHLEVNPSKTKITVFSNRKVKDLPVFTYNGQVLEVDDSFVYLGTMFTYNGRFHKNQLRLVDQARKSMFAVLRKARRLHLPVDIQLQLFDSMVAPILLYGAEVTGYEHYDAVERLCLQFYKIILKAKKSTPNLMLYGELGRYPIHILAKSRMIGFWQRLINGKRDKISYKLYQILFAMHQRDLFHSKWLLAIKNTLMETDNDYFWLFQNDVQVPGGISKVVKTKLIGNYKTQWKDSVYVSPKCLNYRIYKQDLKFENYFSFLPEDLAIAFCHFRTLNHKMPIEWGRFVGTERDDRICELCFLNRLGDEYHYLLECSYFSDLRKLYIPKDLFTRPNTTLFEELMSINDTLLLFKLAKYCKIVLKTFNEIFSNI